MKLKYKGFLIKSISYELKHSPKVEQPVSDMSIGDGQVAVSRTKPISVIITMNIKAYTKDKGAKEESQALSLSVDCIFEIDTKETDIAKLDDQGFKEVIQEHAMNFCLLKAEELVKQITSLDYGRPIIVQKVTLPSGIKLFKPDD